MIFHTIFIGYIIVSKSILYYYRFDFMYDFELFLINYLSLDLLLTDEFIT